MMTLTSKELLDTKLFEKIVRINLFGSVYVSKYVSAVMAKNKPLNDKGERGLIIFTSSIAAEEA